MTLRAVTAVWRSVWVPRVLTAVGLILGLPMFLRMPPWADITLYDNAARCVLNGGAHYRDVFDTNPPGFVWALTAVRAVPWIGTTYEFLWLVDLAVVAGIVLLIDRLAKWGGAAAATRWWAFAGVAFFYPFVTEAIHAQRDVWMSLPALLAIVRRVRRTRDPARGTLGPFWSSAIEGVLWGLAVWVKPHVMVMAVAIWLLTIRRVGGNRPWIGALLDLAGNLAGGVVVGLAGLGLLAVSGSWSAFRDVFENWNQDYVGLMWRELDDRYKTALHWFPPWSLFLIPTVPLALISVLDGRLWSNQSGPGPGPISRWLPRWLYDPGADENTRFARAVLGGAYLTWAAQSLYLQRGFQYVHVVETLLMFGLWAAHRWALPAVLLLWFAVTSTVWLVADANPDFRQRLLTVAYDDLERDHYLVRHPLANPQRMQWWPTCWNPCLSWREQGQLRDGIKYVRNHEASIGWEEIEEVGEFLRSQKVQDGEVICWHDSPHAVYLIAGEGRTPVKPGLRFMHVYTVLVMGKDAEKRLFDEVNKAQGIRFIVTDLQIYTLNLPPERPEWQLITQPPRCPPRDLLPRDFPPEWRGLFPFSKQTVFRSGKNQCGRYVVHRADVDADWWCGPPSPDGKDPWANMKPGWKNAFGP
jgi:hypothetical protein